MLVPSTLPYLTKQTFHEIWLAATQEKLDWQRDAESLVRLFATQVEHSLRAGAEIKNLPFGVAILGLDGASGAKVKRRYSIDNCGTTEPENNTFLHTAAAHFAEVDVVPLLVIIIAILSPPFSESNHPLLQSAASLVGAPGQHSFFISATSLDGRTIHAELPIERHGERITAIGEFDFSTNLVDSPPPTGPLTNQFATVIFDVMLNIWGARFERGFQPLIQRT